MSRPVKPEAPQNHSPVVVYACRVARDAVINRGNRDTIFVV